MEVHKKIDSEEEYIEYFKSLIYHKDVQDIWKEEDRPLLETFFNWSFTKVWPMSEDVKVSFDHYDKCRKEYANELSEIKDSLRDICEYSLAEAFGFKIMEDYNGEVEDYVLEAEHKYPLIITGYIDSGFDRLGKSSVCIIRFVYLEDFNVL